MRLNGSGYFPNVYPATSNPVCSSVHHHHYHPRNPYHNYYFGAYNNNSHNNGGHGKLQKSLSFAFQTPQMISDFHNNSYGCQNISNQFSNHPGER